MEVPSFDDSSKQGDSRTRGLLLLRSGRNQSRQMRLRQLGLIGLARQGWAGLGHLLCVLALVQPRPREIKHGAEEGGKLGPAGRDCTTGPPPHPQDENLHSLGVGWGSPPSILDSFSILEMVIELLMRDEN